ncbi:hypothetical protein KUW04_12820 [Halomonas denitrificans]|nr:hypothetical protein [Halomonas denitrificans]
MDKTKYGARSPLISLARWVAFIPAGVIGGMIGGAIIGLIFGLGSWLYGMAPDAPINMLFVAGISGYLSI